MSLHTQTHFAVFVSELAPGGETAVCVHAPPGELEEGSGIFFFG